MRLPKQRNKPPPQAPAFIQALRPQPKAARPVYENALKLAAAGDSSGAIAALREATRLDPSMSAAWRKLGECLARAGDAAGADRAFASYIKSAADDAELMRAAEALLAGKLSLAEKRLTARLKSIPTDVAALRLMAETCMGLSRYGDAEALLHCALELAPSFAAARHNLGVVLFRLGKAAAAVPHMERLLRDDPRNPNYLVLLASSLAMIGQYERAIGIYETVLRDVPRDLPVWLSYGNALRHLGRRADSVRAYRTCIDIAPASGEAYWSLANLKSETFAKSDIDAMRHQLARTDIAASDRVQLHYALATGLEQVGAYEESFTHYEAGSRLRRGQLTYRAEDTTARVQATAALFSPEFIAARTGMGCQTTGPIFVLGMPRAGSTLIEQILSSHSQVEGTMELPEMVNIERDLLARPSGGKSQSLNDRIAALTPEDLAALGARYIENTRIYRKTEKPCFVDKLPENWLRIGLIHLILPNARIIDARRNPMASCFSNFKQYYPHGQDFSYDLADLGRYYRDYVHLTRHFDTVLPGQVHRVTYEQMVANTESEVRRLLQFCGLPFEPGCLRFWENSRAVHTSSSEQVRKPIFREGLDYWRHYEPWLGKLRDALEEEKNLLF